MTRSLIQHIDAIYTDQSVDYMDTLPVSDVRSYSTFMVNRWISMNPHYIEIVNQLQLYGSDISPRESYLFYSQLIPKGKQYNKYIKSSKSVKYEDWLIDLIRTHFEVSRIDAIEYLHIFYASDKGKADLRSILEMYAIEPKKITKVFQ